MCEYLSSQCSSLLGQTTKGLLVGYAHRPHVGHPPNTFTETRKPNRQKTMLDNETKTLINQSDII